jgi:hypothetical protein
MHPVTRDRYWAHAGEKLQRLNLPWEIATGRGRVGNATVSIESLGPGLSMLYYMLL